MRLPHAHSEFALRALGCIVKGGRVGQKQSGDDRGSPVMRRMMLRVEEMRRGGGRGVIVFWFRGCTGLRFQFCRAPFWGMITEPPPGV